VKTIDTTRKHSVCPRCRGKKTLATQIFGERRVVLCHVCKGQGTVPLPPRDPLIEVRDTMLGKILDKAQQRLF
jgi:hypothetical protein